jgi:tetratricopeptide (TPR) repeat protein
MRPRLPVLALAASLSLAACGGDPPPKPAPGKGGPGGTSSTLGTKTLGRKFPEFTPSGMKEESAKFKELKSAVRYSKVVEEKAAAQKALDEFIATFPGAWENREVPAPEALMYASILQECKQYPRAVTQVKRWLEVAPDDNINWTNAHSLLITCLAQAGEYDSAEAELKSAYDNAYKNRDADRKGVEETIAVAMYKAGKLELAAHHFEVLATTGFGDQESGIYAVDCWLRLGKPDEAKKIAERAADFIKEGKAGERMKQLKAQVALVGKPAPGFTTAKYWKGSGGPITNDGFKGKVTVVFSWNMQKQWNSWFFKRLTELASAYQGGEFQLVGVSRLAKFDATKMAVKQELTEEDELNFYEMWCAQYGVTYPLAIGGYNDEALMDAWAAHVVPSYAVVGKDGVVTYIRTGKEEEHFAVLKEMVDRAMK